MKSTWLLELLLTVAFTLVTATVAPKPSIAAGPTDDTTSIFDFGRDPEPTSPSVQPPTRPAANPGPAAVRPPGTLPSATAGRTPAAVASSAVSPSAASSTPHATQSPTKVVQPPAGQTPAGAAPARLPLPTKDEQAAAERLIREAYSNQYADPAPAAKATLAVALLKQADDPANSPAAQFVLLRDAADVSARVGDARTAMSAITAAARHYQLDPRQELAVRDAATALAARAATAPAMLKEIAAQSESLCEAALRLEQFDAAERLATTAGFAAAKANDAALIRSAQRQSRDVNAARPASAAAHAAADVLATNPADPVANLTVGRYRSLLLGDWDGGLPLLAKGSDPALKAAAEADLAKPSTGVACKAAGDAWWDQAATETKEPIAAGQCNARAGYWYRLAVGQLSGLAKTLVEKRLASLPEPSRLPVASAQQSIDLLKLIDPKRDRVSGEFRFEGSILETPDNSKDPPKLQIPCTPPAEYDVTLEAQRLTNEPGGLVVGFVTGTRQSTLILDNWSKHFSGLETVDGKEGRKNETTYKGPVFPIGRTVVATLKVRRDGIAVMVDGTAIIDWKGDASRLGVGRLWVVPNKGQLFLGSQSRFRIQRMVLTPVPAAGGRP